MCRTAPGNCCPKWEQPTMNGTEMGQKWDINGSNAVLRSGLGHGAGHGAGRGQAPHGPRQGCSGPDLRPKTLRPSDSKSKTLDPKTRTLRP
eukprot:1670062-Rhodomonas_salina.3